MLSLEADHFPSLRDGLHLWSSKNAFMQIAGTITGQSRVRSSDLGLISESRTGKIQLLNSERRADFIRKTVRGLLRVRRWRRLASCDFRPVVPGLRVIRGSAYSSGHWPRWPAQALIAKLCRHNALAIGLISVFDRSLNGRRIFSWPQKISIRSGSQSVINTGNDRTPAEAENSASA